MLWYKAWLETRSRFLAFLVLMVILIGFFVSHAESIMSAEPEKNTYEVLFFAQFYLSGLWILAVVLIGMGGLMRERAVGASPFTLALPVSRSRLMSVRIVTGIVQSVLLAVIPWAVIVAVSFSAGRPFLLSQACFYIFLLVGGGLVYFALAVLFSSLLEGEYTVPAVAYGVVVAAGIIGGSVDKLRPFLDLWRFITAESSVNKSTFRFSGHIPWIGIIASLLVASAMFLASLVVTERTEF
jgi:ABC-2 type transport system permease protein